MSSETNADRPTPERPTDGDPFDLADLSPEDRARAEEALAEMQEVRRRVAEVPAVDVIANHLMGFFELATVHLDQSPPAFAEAAVAIDAFRAVFERLEGRFGDNESVLTQALFTIQQTFVDLANQADRDTVGD